MNKGCALLSSIFAAGILATAGPAWAQGNGRALTLAVHPYLPARELADRFGPLADHLSRVLSRPVQVGVSKDYKAHEDRVGRDQVDIAYLGPVAYVKVVEKYGNKILLARQAVNGRPFFQGYIVVRRDSPLKTLGDLKGGSFAFGDPESTMSHLVPRYMLLKAGVPVTGLARHQFLGSHNNAALGVLVGDFDAGGIKEEVYHQYKDKGLRALATSPKLSEHLFIAARRAGGDIAQTLRMTLLNLHKDAEGRAILSKIKSTVTRLAPVRDSDYDSLRYMLAQLDNAKDKEK